jgi:hypothetical protein
MTLGGKGWKFWALAYLGVGAANYFRTMAKAPPNSTFDVKSFVIDVLVWPTQIRDLFSPSSAKT